MNAQRRPQPKKQDPSAAAEPEEKQPADEQTITLDAKNRTVEVAMRGKDGQILLKALAVFIVVSSLALLLICAAKLIEVIGQNFFDTAGVILWLICLFGSVCWSHWPQ